MEISTDQKTIKLEFEFEFIENRAESPNCLFCIFHHKNFLISCSNMPCRAANRKDKKNGYYKLKEK